MKHGRPRQKTVSVSRKKPQLRRRGEPGPVGGRSTSFGSHGRTKPTGHEIERLTGSGRDTEPAPCTPPRNAKASKADQHHRPSRGVRHGGGGSSFERNVGARGTRGRDQV